MSLILGTDGNLYGTILAGGAHGDGTVFKITPSGDAHPAAQFLFAKRLPGRRTPANRDWCRPPDGNFYGTTILGEPTGTVRISK